MENQTRLVRPREGRMIGGVCAGLARHVALDVSLIRVLWALFVCVGGTGLLAYLLCWIIIPEE